MEETRSTLIKAALQSHINAIKALLVYGVEANIRNNNGWTTLMVAAKNGHTDTVLLLDKGAKVNAVTIDDYTALTSATWKNYSKIIRLLRMSGAKSN